MRILLEFDVIGNVLLDSAPESIKRTRARVSCPTKYESSGATSSDHLIVNQIRREATKSQITSSLTNNFVRGSKTNQMCEPLDNNHTTVMHKPANGFLHRHQFGLRRHAAHYDFVGRCGTSRVSFVRSEER